MSTGKYESVRPIACPVGYVRQHGMVEAILSKAMGVARGRQLYKSETEESSLVRLPRVRTRLTQINGSASLESAAVSP